MERKFCLFALLIILAVAMGGNGTKREGVPEEQLITPEEGLPPAGARSSRVRRMSCDALSFPLPYGYMNHAACASYCFVSGQNFRGHCEFGWCKCK